MRLKKHLLPKVHPSKVKKGLDFATLEAKYAAMDKSPLKITATMANPTVANGGYGIHLDGILSWAVLTAHPCTYEQAEFLLTPLPLETLDFRGDLPLWAASDFMTDKIHTGREYWHKRYPANRVEFAAKRNANTSAGRWREYRVPLNLNVTHAFTAYAIGNRDEVARLLDYVTHLGKKSAYGYGRVVKWSVEECGDCLELIHNNRLLPIEYARRVGLDGGIVPAACWTPPYWYRPHQATCMDMRR